MTAINPTIDEGGLLQRIGSSFKVTPQLKRQIPALREKPEDIDLTEDDGRGIQKEGTHFAVNDALRRQIPILDELDQQAESRRKFFDNDDQQAENK